MAGVFCRFCLKRVKLCHQEKLVTQFVMFPFVTQRRSDEPCQKAAALTDYAKAAAQTTYLTYGTLFASLTLQIIIA